MTKTAKVVIWVIYTLCVIVLYQALMTCIDFNIEEKSGVFLFGHIFGGMMSSSFMFIYYLLHVR